MQTIHFVKNEAAVNVILDYYQDAPPTAFVHSFGCQQNVNDGEKILGVLVNAG